jgi:peptide chain release factor 1
MDEYESASKSVQEFEEILSSGEDAELVLLAREEIETARAGLREHEDKLKLLLIPKDANDSKSAIVEIRAGTGGEEAGLFARDMFRMYSKYAERKGYRLELMSSNPTEIGGFKEVIFLLEGEDAYGTAKFESGVHRVQRIPATEAAGRIHTSAVSVAVLPEAEDVEIEVNEKDL